MEPKKLFTPIMESDIARLKAGDKIILSGTIYAARDQAHKKLCDMIDKNEKFPFDMSNQIIYYVGPCPAKEGEVIGSAGPTTSSRMDAYTPMLLEKGLKGMIGKGLRNGDVKKSIIKNHAIYFGATGGAAALIANSIVEEKIIAFPELGPEALRELKVIDFPLIVIIDSEGNDLYEIGKKRYVLI